MENLESNITKDKTPMTCTNRSCEYRGIVHWCYRNQEDGCAVYRAYERGIGIGPRKFFKR